MSEIIRKEQDWSDRVEPDEEPDDTEKTYRDGSAMHECWNPGGGDEL